MAQNTPTEQPAPPSCLMSDPGCAWLAVPSETVRTLERSRHLDADLLAAPLPALAARGLVPPPPPGAGDGRAEPSRMTPDLVLIDEWRLPLFLRATDAAGLPVDYDRLPHHHADRSPVRDLLPFSADLLRKGFVGASARLADGTEAHIVGIDRKPDGAGTLLMVDGGRFPQLHQCDVAKAGRCLSDLQPPATRFAPDQFLSDRSAPGEPDDTPSRPRRP